VLRVEGVGVVVVVDMRIDVLLSRLPRIGRLALPFIYIVCLQDEAYSVIFLVLSTYL
jgi:hypothetical protein